MKLGVREICNVVLKAKSKVVIGSHTFQKGEPVIYLDTAKTSTMESSATTVYAMGGRGNSRLIAWEGEKVLTFTVEDALISPKGLAILSGADLIQAGAADGKNIKAKSIIAHKTETLSVGSSTTSLTVGKTIAEGTDVYVMLLDANGEVSGSAIKASGSGTTVTVGASLLSNGDTVLVDYYTTYAADATQIDITPDKFAGYYYLEAETLFRRQLDGVDLPAIFILPKVKIQSNFTFTMASSGDPSSFTFTMDAFPDYVNGDKTKKVLASIQILDADDNCDLTKVEDAGSITYKRYTYDKDGCSYVNPQNEKFTADDTPVEE